jgi:membrane-associated phospholipid phosphatase
MQRIQNFDVYWFKLINQQWANTFFDFLMPWLRNSILWAPLYLFLLLFVGINFKKQGWYWVVFAIIVATVANYISSDLIKGNIYRVRPCNNPALIPDLRNLIGYWPRNSSFTSSHATNHMAFAAFIYFTLKPNLGKVLGLFFVWAIAIGYAQIYVGVHYLTDIVAGFVLGFIIGYSIAKVYNKKFTLVLQP